MSIALPEGIHSGVPIADYIRDPAPAPSLNTSAAKAMLEQCPALAHFAHPRLNPPVPGVEDEEFSKNADIGSIAHDLFLEENNNRLVIVDANDWRTKAAKELRETARAEGKIAILAHKWPEIQAMVLAAHKALHAAEYDVGARVCCDVEQTLIWEEAPGVWCRSRPDMLAKDRKMVIEYKTTSTSAEPFAFSRQIITMGYDLQAALIRAGTFKLFGCTPDVVFMVQENTPPYLCSFVGLSPMYAELADQKLQAAVKRWGECITSNRWPAYPSRVAWVEPPAWAMARAEELAA